MKKIDADLLKTMPLPDWGDEADKGTRGKLLIVGGSARIPGATLLAARAALRSGCGSVRVAAPASIALHLGIAVPELMVVPLPETKSGTIAQSAIALVAEQCKLCDAVVLGPGLDANTETDAFAREVVAQAPLPLLIDAQAISALDAKFEAPDAPRVLTPHEKEYEAFMGEAPGADHEAAALKAAQKTHCVVLLKGHLTYIATPGGEVYENEAGTRALGTAGSGDVLAGIIGSLLAQGLSAEQATVWGAHMHSQAGEAVAKDGGDDGLMARDFIDRLPGVQKYLRRLAGDKKAGGFGLRRN